MDLIAAIVKTGSSMDVDAQIHFHRNNYLNHRLQLCISLTPYIWGQNTSKNISFHSVAR